ncbi:MAG: PTS sugar transporter subunit IIA [Planctomycetes bacterium]|nr:PTS sugar transporter subunit IIA [Planctomycetota bacterium]
MQKLLLSKIIPKESIVVNLTVDSKKEIIKKLILAAKKTFKVKTPTDKLFKTVMEREKLGSTAIGCGVAIPHAKFKGLNTCIGSFVKLKTSVKDYVGIDGLPVSMAFLVLAGENSTTEYTESLKLIMKLVNDKEKYFNFLQQAKDPEAVFYVFEEIDCAQQTTQ